MEEASRSMPAWFPSSHITYLGGKIKKNTHTLAWITFLSFKIMCQWPPALPPVRPAAWLSHASSAHWVVCPGKGLHFLSSGSIGKYKIIQLFASFSPLTHVTPIPAPCVFKFTFDLIFVVRSSSFLSWITAWSPGWSLFHPATFNTLCMQIPEDLLTDLIGHSLLMESGWEAILQIMW